MRTKTQAVYAITLTLDGRRYIGSSVRCEYRLSQHLRLLRQGQHPNPYLQAAFLKYREITFEFEIVEVVKDQLWLRAREQAWIFRTKSLISSFGFNICKNAWVGDVMHDSAFAKQIMRRPDVVQKCSQAAKERFADPTKAAEWREARRQSRAITRANNTRYANEEAHKITSRAAKEAHARPETRRKFLESHSRITKEFRAWCGRKSAAKRAAIPFTEPKPEVQAHACA